MGTLRTPPMLAPVLTPAVNLHQELDGHGLLDATIAVVNCPRLPTNPEHLLQSNNMASQWLAQGQATFSHRWAKNRSGRAPCPLHARGSLTTWASGGSAGGCLASRSARHLAASSFLPQASYSSISRSNASRRRAWPALMGRKGRKGTHLFLLGGQKGDASLFASRQKILDIHRYIFSAPLFRPS
jgi:hypothetical protein